MPVGEVKAAEAMALAVRWMDVVMEATGAVEAVTAKEEAAVAEETRDGGGSLCRHM